MRPDVWISFLLCASVFAKPPEEDYKYSIEIFRNGTTNIYHKKCVEIIYNTKESVKITFIQSGDEELPFMILYWNKDGQRVKRGEIIHDFRSEIQLQLNPDANDCKLECEIWFRSENTQTLVVHFIYNVSPKENNIQNVGNLFKIILIALGAFIGISILIMILMAVYKHFRNKLSSRYNNTVTYPDYSEIIPMNKINNKPKSGNVNADSERDIVDSRKEAAFG